MLSSIIAEGGDPATGFFPGKFSDVADGLSICFKDSKKNLSTTGDHLLSKKVLCPLQGTKIASFLISDHRVKGQK